MTWRVRHKPDNGIITRLPAAAAAAAAVRRGAEDEGGGSGDFRRLAGAGAVQLVDQDAMSQLNGASIHRRRGRPVADVRHIDGGRSTL